MLLKIPDYNELNISQGKIYIDELNLRRGSQLNLISNNEKLKFRCWIYSGGDKSCISKEDIVTAQGKLAKVWWFKANIFGLIKENRLVQLEINHQLVVRYEKQKARYLYLKDQYSYIWLILLVASLVWFLLLQFANNTFSHSKN